MGCHTQQENDALVLSPQSEHGAGSKAVGRAREPRMDFQVRSLHSNPEEEGEQPPLQRGWSDSTEGGLQGAGCWEGSHGLGSLLCLALGAHAQAPPSLQSWNSKEVAQRQVWGGVQGLSRSCVPGHLSHKKGTRRRVKVAVKV